MVFLVRLPVVQNDRVQYRPIEQLSEKDLRAKCKVKNFFPNTYCLDPDTNLDHNLDEEIKGELSDGIEKDPRSEAERDFSARSSNWVTRESREAQEKFKQHLFRKKNSKRSEPSTSNGENHEE